MITEGSTTIRAGLARALRSAPLEDHASAANSTEQIRGKRSRAVDQADAADTHADERGLLWRRAAWAAAAVLWAFAALALISFDPGDAPSRTVAPHNQPAANWCGPAGAVAAHYGYELLGYGAWMLMALGALALWVLWRGHRISHAGIRLIGGLLMAAVVSGFQALVLPGTGPIANLPGGVAGAVGVARLVESFSSIGTFLVLVVALGVGATIALDVWAFIAAMWTGRLLYSAGRAGGRLAVQAAARGAQAARERRRARLDRDASQELEAKLTASAVTAAGTSTQRGRGKKAAVAPIDPEAGGLGGHEPFNPDSGLTPAAAGIDADLPGDAPGSAVESDETDDDAPGAPQVFDPQALRARMAKLPVRFAAQTTRSATEDDLRDIQNQGELEGYQFPGLDLLEEPEANFSQTMEGFVREQAEALERALKEYRIEGGVVGVESGPVITLFEVKLAPGAKVAALNAIASDLARSLKAVNIRIVPNTAGRDTVGIEVPNLHKEKVRLKELMTRSDVSANMRLPMFLGKDASGEPLIADLAQMPHVLIAGTTGSGKSVCMNTVIMSFLYTKKPNELKLVLVDPKMVELSQFKDIPHLMCPVVTEMGKAAAILEWAVTKMDERYELLAEAGCRDIATYNELEWEELRERLGLSTPEEEAKVPRRLPYMVFVIDELADLMMTNKEVEQSIVRIAQKARAVGIHLILATQRPQANVVTGLIKSNMPARIAFKVASGMDSRIVLDQKGGELLLGQGDMLYLSPRSSKLTRAQGTLVDDKEIRRVVKFMRDVAAPTFERQLIQLRSASAEGGDAGDAAASEWGGPNGLAAAQEDPLFDTAVEAVLESKRGSVSMLQRRLAIGYTRAARLIEMMGEAGILGQHKGTVAREIAMTIEEWRAMKAQAAADAAAGSAGEATEGETLFDPLAGAKLRAVQNATNADGLVDSEPEDEAPDGEGSADEVSGDDQAEQFAEAGDFDAEDADDDESAAASPAPEPPFTVTTRARRDPVT